MQGPTPTPTTNDLPLGLPHKSPLELWVKRLLFYLGTRYRISPKNVQEGIALCRELDRHGIPSTLGKFSSPGDDPVATTGEFRLASASLKNSHTENGFYLTLKPPRLRFDLGHAMAIASTALANGHGIHFDSHQHDIQDPTLILLEALMKQLPSSSGPAGRWSFSLSLPSRWKRSLVDAGWLAERSVRVRLIKGEFKGPSSADEADPRDNFLTLVDRLAGRVPQLAIATHDYPLAREAILLARSRTSAVEIELLFGIPAGDLLALSREMGVPTRFYVPFGDTILMYGVRHYLAHPHKLLRPGSRDVVRSSRYKLARIIEALAI